MYNCKLIVNHLPKEFGIDDLHFLFSPIGKIKHINLVYNKGGSEASCRGYGFVEYFRSADAAQAISKLNGFPLRNKNLTVDYSHRAKKARKLIIYNVKKDVTKNEIFEAFKNFGKIISIDILKDHIVPEMNQCDENVSTGKVVLTYSSGRSARNAQRIADHKLLFNTQFPVRIQLL